MKTEFKALPNVEAIDYFRGKGFAPALSRFSWKDVWGEEHSRAFTVAKATRDDVLGAIRDSLDQAIAEGRSLKDFKAEMEPVLKSFGWWGRGIVTDPKTGLPEEAQLGSANRLRIIYDTNVRTANSAGRWARAQRNKALMPFFTYIQIDRPSAREAHKPFDGVTLPVDHAFWRTHWAPNGWLCGCMVRQISKRVLERDGLAVTDEAKVAEISKTRPHRNDRTGEVTDVPVGIDPGFAHNPGIARYNPEKGAFDPVPRAPSPSPDSRIQDRIDRKQAGEEVELTTKLAAAPVEQATLFDLAGGTVTRGKAGSRNHVEVPGTADRLRDPGARLAVLHSHPDATPISTRDLQTLSLPGIERVVAVGLDDFRAEARKIAPFAASEVLAIQSRALQLARKGGLARDPNAYPPPLAPDLAGRAFAFLVPRLLEKNGKIVYADSRSPAATAELAPVLDWVRRVLAKIEEGEG